MDYSLDSIKKEAEKETREVFQGQKNFKLADKIDLLFETIQLPIHDPLINLDGIDSLMLNAFNKLLIEGVKNIDRQTYFASFSKIEQFLRKVLFLIDPAALSSIRQKNYGLMQVIKELDLNPLNIDLNLADLKSLEGDQYFVDHLCRVYRQRNQESHEISNLSQKEFGQLIQSYLVIYINTVHKHRVKLTNKVKTSIYLSEPSYTAYCDAIIQLFQKRINRFIHLSSKEDITFSGSYVLEYKLKQIEDQEEVGREGTVEILRQNSIPEKRMMLWGEAGIGKSTTLEYLTYKDAQNLKANNSANIPVYVQLGLLTDSSITLENYIFNKIGVEVSLGKKYLEVGRLNLFLDGLNEITKDFNNQTLTLRQREIDYFIKQYKNTFIILTNRPQQINQFSDVPVFFIQRMNDIQINEFIKKYSEGNKSIEEKIKSAINADERLKRIIKTPLMLSRLIEIVKADGEIPANEGLIIDRFIRSLYKREIIEKKDARFNDRKIHILLSHLASYSLEEKGTNSALSGNEIINTFLKCKREYGFEIDLDYVLDIVCQLNIIERMEDKFIFAHQSYQDYYNTEYERMILGL